jgi:hypothetical protein
MKRTLTVLLCLAALIAGCSLFRTGSGHRWSLFARKVDPHSSPEALMTMYKKYAKAGQPEKLWSLYSADLKKQIPNGLFVLQDKLRRDPITDIHIGNPVVVSEGHVLYFNIVTLKRGDSMLERAALIEEKGKWFIEGLSSDGGIAGDS